MRPERRCANCAHFRGDGEQCASPDWLISTSALRWKDDGQWCKGHERVED